MARIQISDDELQQHLRKQIRFLHNSCKLFDQGDEEEAARIAQVLRILFHDTAGSVSLSRHLRLQDMQMLDTSDPLVHGNELLEMPLLSIGTGGANGTKHFASLDRTRRRHFIPFHNWWRQLVFRNASSHKFSRQRLVTVTANQFGGAHVDSKLDVEFDDIRKGHFGVVYYGDGSDPLLNDAVAVTLRQIGHETLASLSPDYAPPKREMDFPLMMSAVSFSRGSGPAATIGRNQSCPCESGLKYKKCHGSPVV